MRLTTIKLAGFKSFVDPTTLHLPSNMTGIVGPNGCGKSNILDAVRWVLGESAASRLRGDSITDVIFNGSSTRKPVGQASVELLFDNSSGLIAGEYAAYTEISVKRLVGREGQSHYYLNGARCRRRDITDLFLGTGLGPRSYAIIEQGMISQIVEAAPDDLRVHLEEASGISKYKERRKETESRIRATRENLERIADLKNEVAKRLEHLERQAKQAQRYTELKAEQRLAAGRAAALNLQDTESRLAAEREAGDRAETERERLTTELRRVESEGEQAFVASGEANEHFNQVQAESFELAATISRSEQELRFRRDAAERARRELDQTRAQRGQLIDQEAEDKEQLEALNAALMDAEPLLEELAVQVAEAREALEGAEAESRTVLAQQGVLLERMAEQRRQAELERTRLEFLDRRMRDALTRQEGLRHELGTLDPEGQSADSEQARERLAVAQEQVDLQTEALEAERVAVLAGQHRLQQAQARGREAEQELSRAKGRLASLEALQHAALGQDRRELARWLEQRGLAAAPRLAEVLIVEPGWERAVETVLDSLLEAVVVEAPAQHAEQRVPGGVLYLLAPGSLRLPGAADSLAAQVCGPAALLGWLGAVRTAADLDQARAMLPGLGVGQSVITPAGTWLSATFTRLHGEGEAHDGVLARAREIETLQERVEALSEQVEQSRRAQDQARAEVQQAERSREAAQNALYAAHRRVAELSGQLQVQLSRAEAARQRGERIRAELAALATHLDQESAEARGLRAGVEALVEAMAGDESGRQRAADAVAHAQAAVDAARRRLREAEQLRHQRELGIEGQRASRRGLLQALGRIDQQLAALSARRQQLEQDIEQQLAPIPELERRLHLAIEQRLRVDAALKQAREAVEALQRQVQQLERERQRFELALGQSRERLSQHALAVQALELKAQQFGAQLAERELDPAVLLAELPEGLTAAACEAAVAELELRIRRLEPVNLAAIGELAEQQQRRDYLDIQTADLNVALESLEEAIRKIDKETRTRFKETFDNVNAGMQELFPRLFGGGSAYLELTGDDLLSTGVTIVARPPGKRPANIALLSGGEKALTAVALVFAIFKLNPAPFCILDEVDAPLDEANVGRFSTMVREMSSSVQFIFVSHNKVTMEAATQLCGVTMREPGVSRLVQVDLAEAARLAGAEA
ncbi:MAG: chromosome segregation protein SMC [Xanthomonadales bacterium]|jgi:chromosome segregation protein|nr:chromosome segregation protein SMC [Xanthomonadales bacterium]